MHRRVLSMRSLNKLTLIWTLTLTVLNRNICAHMVDTQKFFVQIYKRNFLHEERSLGLEVGQIIALPTKIRRWLI